MKLHGNRHQQSHNLSGLCTFEPDCWALLPTGQQSAGPGMLETALPLVLTKHPETRTLARQEEVWLKKKLFVVFSSTQVTPRRIYFLSRPNSLVKASWICCGLYLHSVSRCPLCITVPQIPSCKGKLYQHSPPFSLSLGMNHAIHAEIDLCKSSRAH